MIVPPPSRDGVRNSSFTGGGSYVENDSVETARPGGYWRVQGTSFAAPMVSGAAALIRSRWPTMSAAEVVNRVIKTAKDRGSAGRDGQYGYGLIETLATPIVSVGAVASG